MRGTLNRKPGTNPICIQRKSKHIPKQVLLVRSRRGILFRAVKHGGCGQSICEARWVRNTAPRGFVRGLIPQGHHVHQHQTIQLIADTSHNFYLNVDDDDVKKLTKASD